MYILKKNKCFAMMALLLILLFSSCHTDKDEASVSIDSSYGGTSKTVMGNEGAQRSQTVQHIETTLHSGVHVNADVTILPSVHFDKLRTYKAALKTQSYNKAKEILLKNRDIREEYENQGGDDLAPSFAETTDGYFLTSSVDGSNLHFSGALSYEIMDAFQGNSYVNPFRNDAIFLKEDDLGFSSKETVKQEILGIMEELGISIYKTPVVYTFSKGARYAVTLFSGEEMKEEERQISEDCYLFEFCVTADDLPVAQEPSGTDGNGSYMNGTRLKVLYSQNGIEYLELYYQPEVTETISEEKGLMVEEALQKLDDKYGSVILEGEYHVEQIGFEYIPIPQQGDNQFLLVPAWRFGVLHTVPISSKEAPEVTEEWNDRAFIIFNAVTGEEILNEANNI